MSIITKWALQAVALFLLGWVATVTANWSNTVVSGTGNDRLAELNTAALSNTAARVSRTPALSPEHAE